MADVKDEEMDQVVAKEEGIQDGNGLQDLSPDQIQAFCDSTISLNLTPDNFRDNMLKCGRALFQKYGGPWNYLSEVLPSAEQIASFYVELETVFPRRADCEYTHWATLPNNEEDVFCLHLSDLSFDPSSSTKPAPFSSTCLELLDEFLTNDFITAGLTHSW